MQKIIRISMLFKKMRPGLALAIFLCMSTNAQYITPHFSDFEAIKNNKDSKHQVGAGDLAELELQFAIQEKIETEKIVKAEGKWFVDSAYHYLNGGYSPSFFHSYYYYGPDFILDSILKFTLNETSQRIYNNEIRKFDKAGNLLLYIERGPDRFYADSLIYDLVIKEYTYSSGRLVRVRTENKDEYSFRFPFSTEIVYTYNDDGQLLTDSTFSLDYLSVYSANSYAYYPDGKRKYKYERTENATELTKYTYDYTDTSLLRTVTDNYFLTPISTSLDDLTDFYYFDYYYEIFDDAGRRKSLSHSTLNLQDRPDTLNDYKSLYTYNADGSLQQISYYDWMESGTEGKYREYVRQKYFYNEQGNIERYEQWFYDDRLMQWVMEESIDYYYTEYAREVGLSGNRSMELEVWPNPVSTELYLNIAEPEGIYAIYNNIGEVVQQGILKTNTISLENLPANSYYLVVRGKSQLYTAKIVKL